MELTYTGIMCGYIAGVALAHVKDGMDSSICNIKAGNLLSWQCSSNWRLILASPVSSRCRICMRRKLETPTKTSQMVLPLVVVFYAFCLPESPRWLLMRARAGNNKKYEEAFNALVKLRHTKLQAGRDLFLINHLLQNEEEIMKQQNPFSELLTVGRNRRALTASVITMFLQQFCGVNVTAYYSSKILKDHASYSPQAALLISMGFGIINFRKHRPRTNTK